MDTKICTHCQSPKLLDQFYKNKKGYETQCKECRLERMGAKYRAKYPNVVRRSGEGIWTEDKRCSCCHLFKSILEFQKHSKRSDGITSTCKECINNRNKTGSYREYAKINLRKNRKIRLEKDPITFKLQRMVLEARSRAKKKDIPFDLTFEYLKTILTDKCPVLNISFNFSNPKLSCDESPTIDRFYPDKGYVKGNVSIISRLANVMKNKGTVEQHIQLTDWLMLTENNILGIRENHLV